MTDLANFVGDMDPTGRGASSCHARWDEEFPLVVATWASRRRFYDQGGNWEISGWPNS